MRPVPPRVTGVPLYTGTMLPVHLLTIPPLLGVPWIGFWCKNERVSRYQSVRGGYTRLLSVCVWIQVSPRGPVDRIRVRNGACDSVPVHTGGHTGGRQPFQKGPVTHKPFQK
jgi:hypothetical protein